MTGKKKVSKPEAVVEEPKVVEIEPEVEETEAVVEAEAIAEPETKEVTGPTLASVPIGTNFRYGGGVYKKINHGTVLNFQNDDDATESMDNGAIVDPILPGHDIEPDA